VKAKLKGRKVKEIQRAVQNFLEPLKEAALQSVNLKLQQVSDKENVNIGLHDAIVDNCSQNHKDVTKMAYLQAKHGITQKYYREIYMFDKSIPKPTKLSAMYNTHLAIHADTVYTVACITYYFQFVFKA